MEHALVEEIRARLDEFTATERRAAQALMANYPFLGLQTVAQFADAAGVSSPTILRFVARLGFPGFPEFQRRLKSEIENQLKAPLARDLALPSADTGCGNAYADKLVENLRETFQHLPAREIEAFVRLLADERRTVYLLGGRFTDALARYMAAHLRIVRPGVHHLAGQESNWLDQLIGMGPKDVLVVFDIRRYQAGIVRFAEAAARQGVTVGLITDSWMSPVARISQHVLPVRVAVPSPWDSSTALMAVAEVLIAGVTRENWQRSEQRMQALEALRNGADPVRPLESDDGEARE
ncbi:SIS domain-containing protein [Microvirga tunisiensis]|uniref:SIS domain-containing protein n=2 Tax=Pannonibacter tanglangensis TaxID=2750084 RepID=A0A7X5F3K8_9HYPH|nr:MULTISPECIES: MurR/RpiR family transcriptional regulator [unclassified Pannonibacter]NBN64586.1 SIS domain-containing protein [Pannonibacter sp. XCT-34]NBN79121.1 SIS domain-containing protein [Pannonibacter sp. XCT-53]